MQYRGTWQQISLTGLLTTLCFTFFGCPPAEEPEPPVTPAVQKALEGKGSIAGTITYKGKKPKLPEIAITEDACKAKHKTPVYDEKFVLGDGNPEQGVPLSNVLVAVKSGIPQGYYPAPKTPVVLDQEGCVYKPHVFGVMVRQPLKILNSDEPVFHNVHILCKDEKNIGMPKGVKEKTVRFSKEEPVFEIKCDVHPWMKSHCKVMPHPYFAVTGKDGKFTIANLQPDTYEIEVWHEDSKMQIQPGKTQKITLRQDGEKKDGVDFVFVK